MSFFLKCFCCSSSSVDEVKSKTKKNISISELVKNNNFSYKVTKSSNYLKKESFNSSQSLKQKDSNSKSEAEQISEFERTILSKNSKTDNSIDEETIIRSHNRRIAYIDA